MGKRYSEEEIHFLINNYPVWGSVYCSKQLGRPKSSLIMKSSSLGLTAKNAFKHPSEFKNFDYSITQTPNKEFAYTLGFLWADGYISKYKRVNGKYRYYIGYEMCAEDSLNIEDIFDSIGSWNRWSRKRENHWKKVTHSRMDNRWLFWFLEDLGFKNKNSGFKNCLAYLPEELHKYFILGYFDGDGHTNFKDRINFTAPINYVWDDLVEYFKPHKFHCGITRYSHPTLNSKQSKFTIQNRKGVEWFKNNLLIPNCKFGIKRKRPKPATIQCSL